MQDIPDIDLIQRAQNKRGDPGAGAEAVGALYDRYQQAVFRYVWARVSNPQLAEDLTGEVFARMLSHLPGYKVTSAPFLAWLYAIARNLVADHHRKTAGRNPLTDNYTLPRDWNSRRVASQSRPASLSARSSWPKAR